MASSPALSVSNPNTMPQSRAECQIERQMKGQKERRSKHMSDTSSTAQGGGGSFKNRKPIGEVGCCESGIAERSH